MAQEIAEQAQDQEKKREHRGERTTTAEYLESLLVTVLLALFGTTFVAVSYTHLTLPTICSV